MHTDPVSWVYLPDSYVWQILATACGDYKCRTYVNTTIGISKSPIARSYYRAEITNATLPVVVTAAPTYP